MLLSGMLHGHPYRKYIELYTVDRTISQLIYGDCSDLLHA